MRVPNRYASLLMLPLLLSTSIVALPSPSTDDSVLVHRNVEDPAVVILPRLTKMFKQDYNPKIKPTKLYAQGKAKMRPSNYKHSKNFQTNPWNMGWMKKAAKKGIKKMGSVGGDAKACMTGKCGVPQPWNVGKRDLEERDFRYSAHYPLPE